MQVYLALALLVEAGGGDAGKALAAADAEFAALAPDAKSKVCWDPACKAPALHGYPCMAMYLLCRCSCNLALQTIGATADQGASLVFLCNISPMIL